MEKMNNESEKSIENNIITTASRTDRFGAALIDGIIMIVIAIPIMYLTGFFDKISNGIQPSFTYSLLMGLMGILIFILVNGKLLSKSGQTIGKRAVGIKIVTLNGELPEIKDHLLKRYGVYFLLGNIPIIGQFLSLVNILLILGSQKRCGHDLIAGTTVVNSKYT